MKVKTCISSVKTNDMCYRKAARNAWLRLLPGLRGESGSTSGFDGFAVIDGLKCQRPFRPTSRISRQNGERRLDLR